jgi:hypothetical protein
MMMMMITVIRKSNEWHTANMNAKKASRLLASYLLTVRTTTSTTKTTANLNTELGFKTQQRTAGAC